LSRLVVRLEKWPHPRRRPTTRQARHHLRLAAGRMRPHPLHVGGDTWGSRAGCARRDLNERIPASTLRGDETRRHGIQLLESRPDWPNALRWLRAAFWSLFARTAMPFVKCSVDGCSQKLQPILKVDPRDRDTWFYRECDVCDKHACEKHSAEVEGRIICDRGWRAA